MPKSFKSCSVFGCPPGSWSQGKEKQYSFPKDPHLQQKWIKLCTRKSINPNYASVCARHFSSKQKSRNLQHELLNYKPRSYRDLKEDAVPDLYLPKFGHSVDDNHVTLTDEPDSPTLQCETEQDVQEMLQEKPKAAPECLPTTVLPPTTMHQPLSIPETLKATLSSQQQPPVAVPQSSIVSSSLPPQLLSNLLLPQTLHAKSSMQQQQPQLPLARPQTSNIGSSIHHQPFLTLAVPQMSASVCKQPIFALAMPPNFAHPSTLPHQGFPQLAMAQASNMLPSIQQQSLKNFPNSQLSNYLTFVQQQPMLNLPKSQVSASQNLDLQPPQILSSPHHFLPTNTVPVLINPLLEHAKQPEFVEVKEEPEEESPDNVIKDEFLSIHQNIACSTSIEEEPTAVPDQMDENNAAHTPPCTFGDEAPRPSFVHGNGLLLMEGGADSNEPDLPNVEVKVEIEEDCGVVNLLDEHRLESRHSEEDDHMVYQQSHEPLKDISLCTDAVGSSTSDEVHNVKQHVLAVHSCHKYDQCSCVSKLSHGLKKNMATLHMENRPFKCSVCSYDSSSKRALQLHHMAKHSSQKPYECKECGYASVYANHVKRHVLAKHPDPSAEKCEYCDLEGDPQSNTFWDHLITAHPDQKTYKCTLCPFTSQRSHRLQKHFLARHPTEKPYKCKWCNFQTAWSHLLKQHAKAEHPKKKPDQDHTESYDELDGRVHSKCGSL